jgi:uncharacterized protein YeeX (DUF496 family)
MTKAEALKIFIFAVENMTINMADIKNFMDFINSMTDDTDPRLAMLDELEEYTDQHRSCEAIHIRLSEMRDRIKQEVGDES